MNGWYDTSREGLRKLVAHKGKAFVLFELLQNCWDTHAKNVTVTLEKVPGRALAELNVEDDDPEGFHDLSHSYTMFAESIKKDDPTLRGRFNLGEKLVLSICKEAAVQSTKGTVRFNANDTRTTSRHKREVGTLFYARIEMTHDEFDEVCDSVHQLIPPAGVTTTFNGELIEMREPLATFEATLATLRADEEGNLKPTKRKTEVRVYEPLPNETPSIYELGIPVVATEGKYHVDVQQKVPLNLDRDNVPPSYLRTIRALLLNEVFDTLDDEEASETWVSDALAHDDVEPDAVEAVLTSRFGKKRAIYDPSDQEANNRLASKGYTIIHGGSLSKGAWGNVRSSGSAMPAGKLSPTPKPWSDDPDAPTANRLDRDKWSVGMNEVVSLVEKLGHELLDTHVQVEIVTNGGRHFAACFGRGGLIGGAHFTFNLQTIGRRWFNNWTNRMDDVLDLIVHEFAHFYESDHLSDKYHKALSKLAGKLAVLVLRKPEMFDC